MSDGSLNASERDAMMRDLGLLLEALGLGDHARPESPHEVMQRCIAEARRLRPSFVVVPPASEPATTGRVILRREQEDGVIQVVMTSGIQETFRQWLASRGRHLFPIPVSDDDLPTYGIGIG